MSKFFQALENADKERAAMQAAVSAPDGGSPAAVPLECEPAAPTTAVLDLPAAPPVAHSDPLAPPAPADVVAHAAPAPDVRLPIARAAVATATDTPAPVGVPASGVARTRAHAAARTAEAPSPMASTYGSPVARSRKNGRAHAGVFVAPGPAVLLEEHGRLDDHLVSLLEPTSFAAEQYRAVRLAIENFRRERGLHVVAMSSPGRGEGKTISAINLAGALAQAPDSRVVLVDADLRHSRVAGYLGLASAGGLSTYLLDTGLAADAVIEKPSSTAFAVVPAGARSSMPYELLKSPRLGTLFTTLRARFDFVVVDTPPVLAFPDAGILRDVVDGFVLVVRANHTPREGLVDGLDTIGRHRVLGLVFNDDGRMGAAAAAVSEREPGWRRYVSFRRGGRLVA